MCHEALQAKVEIEFGPLFGSAKLRYPLFCPVGPNRRGGKPLPFLLGWAEWKREGGPSLFLLGEAE